MQQESVDIASSALEKYNIEKDIAAHIKKEFDRVHGMLSSERILAAVSLMVSIFNSLKYTSLSFAMDESHCEGENLPVKAQWVLLPVLLIVWRV